MQGSGGAAEARRPRRRRTSLEMCRTWPESEPRAVTRRRVGDSPTGKIGAWGRVRLRLPVGFPLACRSASGGSEYVVGARKRGRRKNSPERVAGVNHPLAALHFLWWSICPFLQWKKSRQILDGFVEIWQEAMSKRSLPGHFMHIEPNFAEFGLSDHLHFSTHSCSVCYCHGSTHLGSPNSSGSEKLATYKRIHSLYVLVSLVYWNPTLFETNFPSCNFSIPEGSMVGMSKTGWPQHFREPNRCEITAGPRWLSLL
ncbi:hypothetical protein CK203_074997 [Vitis vinifera]|uniref:Uncharacterized protein n=1 Tax=Vitis vinifera TaxID=29760 RepID=A0A438E8Z1_VITVI|nr:hypothetical protein CK203_074997 [Vitis vinifera]